MIEEELNRRLAQMADAIGRVAEASSSGIEQLKMVQLGSQQQIGLLSDLMIQLTRRVDSLTAGYEQQQEILSNLAASHGQQQELLNSLVAGYEQQQAILNELIRQRPQPPEE